MFELYTSFLKQQGEYLIMNVIELSHILGFLQGSLKLNTELQFRVESVEVHKNYTLFMVSQSDGSLCPVPYSQD